MQYSVFGLGFIVLIGKEKLAFERCEDYKIYPTLYVDLH
jgi:hypothetical protein